MPIKFKAWSRGFIWQLADTGEPIGLLRDIGGALWLTCCPLCGCAHQHGAWQSENIVTPMCVGQYAIVWANWRRIWLEQFPDARGHWKVRLAAVDSPMGESLARGILHDQPRILPTPEVGIVLVG
jgi:hypothetical protein